MLSNEKDFRQELFCKCFHFQIDDATEKGAHWWKVTDLKVMISENLMMSDADDHEKSHQQEWPLWI